MMGIRIVLIISFLTLVSACSRPINPIEKKIGKLHISIDPRIELLSTIQVLSDYEYINRNSLFSREVSDYFKPWSLHSAVIMTSKLENNNNFIYAAPVQFMLDLSALPELKQKTDFSQDLLKRAGGKESLDNYRTSIKQFAKKSNFEKFWKSNEAFYNKILDLTISDMGGADIVKAVEDYYNEKQNSYNIIISVLSNRSYSYKEETPGGKYDVYSCIAARDFKNDTPYIKKEVLIRNATHEFGHSFVDYLTAKYEKRIAESDLLYRPIKASMDLQGYGTWSSCVNEHIVRAINIRIHELTWGKELSEKMLQEEKANQFIYIDQILSKLREFESARNISKITFSEFYPEFLDLFDSLKIANMKEIESMDLSGQNERPAKALNKSVDSATSGMVSTFSGPIDAVFKEKLAWIYPTSDSKENVSTVKEYVTFLFKKIKKENSIFIPDTVALKTDLSEYGLMVYGTIESNLFLSEYRSALPFQIKNKIIIADREYPGEDTKLISCLPNPANPKNGMVVHTAGSNRFIKDINNVKHGDEDFIIFKSRNIVFSKGYYNKTRKWGFNQK